MVLKPRKGLVDGRELRSRKSAATSGDPQRIRQIENKRCAS